MNPWNIKYDLLNFTSCEYDMPVDIFVVVAAAAAAPVAVVLFYWAAF